MTLDQIPGIGARWHKEFFPEASWGLGWNIRGNKKAQFRGTLPSPKSFVHSGAGGVCLWVDPVYEIVGIYFSVLSYGGIPSEVKVSAPLEPWMQMARLDLFINAVTAAVVDL